MAEKQHLIQNREANSSWNVKRSKKNWLCKSIW